MGSSTCGVILAAGLGKRMLSETPKGLHQVAGKAMVRMVYEALIGADVSPIIAVVSPDAAGVANALGPEVTLIVQEDRLGTGHATMQALDAMPDCGTCLVTFCDTPLLQAGTLSTLMAAHVASAASRPGLEATIVTSALADPTGYGRVVRDERGAVCAIVEQASCTPDEAAIQEIFSGIMLADISALRRYLPRLSTDNPQGEYLLTDVPSMVIAGGGRVEAFEAESKEVLGVNSRRQLADANRVIWEREGQRLMDQGVTILDLASTFVAPGVEVGRDTVIWPGSFLLGQTAVGPECVIGPGAHLVDSRLGARVEVRYSTVEQSEAADDVTVGPYAHIRPDSYLGPGVKVGNFAEIKNSRIGPGSKVSHHSYVGDADVGSGVNVGAGTVFVNYDGQRKHRTRVEDDAFIGCNSNLVAPVTLGRGSYVACGSSITRDVPAESLAVARSRQRNVLGWVTRRVRRPKSNQPDITTQTDKERVDAKEQAGEPRK